MTDSVAIIGLGNIFLGDDAFGPLAVEVFRCEYDCDPAVEVIDLGTPGLDLAPYLFGRNLVVILDAVHAESAPGTLATFGEHDFMSSRAKLRITGHDPGLWTSLAHLRLAGKAPSELVVIGLNPTSCGFGEAVHSSVLPAAFQAAAMVASLITDRGATCLRRHVPLQPDFWWKPIATLEHLDESVRVDA